MIQRKFAIKLFAATILVPLVIANLIAFVAIVSVTIDWVDFRHLYTAGYMIRSGHGDEVNDYDAGRELQDRLVRPVNNRAMLFNHLAYEALLFAPFSFARYRIAFYAFLATNLVLTFLSYRLMRYRLGDLQMPFWFPTALFLGFWPVACALSDGQDSIITLACMAGAALLFDRGRELECGMLIGLTLYKFQFGIPIVLLFLIWRHWRVAAGFAVTGVAVSALSLWITGLDGFARYLHSLGSMSTGLSAARQYQYGLNPAMMVNIRGLITGFAGAHLSPSAIQIVVAIASIAIFLCAASRRPSFSLALTTAVLVSYHCFAYEGVLLLIPMCIFVGQILRGKSNTLTSLLIAVILGAPTVLMFAGSLYYLLAIPILIFFTVLCWPQKNQDFSEPAQMVSNPAAISPHTTM